MPSKPYEVLDPLMKYAMMEQNPTAPLYFVGLMIIYYRSVLQLRGASFIGTPQAEKHSFEHVINTMHVYR